MESVLGRYRNLIVLVGVLFAQVLGLAVQVRRTTDNEPTRLIRIWAVGTVTPFERVLVWARTSTNNICHNYFYLRGVRAENRSLKAQIERMNLEQVRMSQDADQARRLQALLAFKEQYISQTMAVITADGVVGKVLNVYRSVSQVLLINDHSSGVGAILEKSRTQGIVRGTAAGEVMLEKVMSDEIVPVGEQVLTSGGDSIFPKGLLVGRVTKVAPGSELFLNIRVSPAADLSKLEEVLVVTKIDERQVQPDKTGAARAVDILAERLPTVPSKPENAEKAATPGADTPRIVTPKSVAPETVSPTTATPKTLAPTIVGPDVKPRTAPSNASIGSGATTAHKSATPLSTNSSASTTKPAAAADATKEPNAQPVVEGAPR